MAANDVEPDAQPEPERAPEQPAAPEADRSQYVVIADADVIAADRASRATKPSRGPLKPDSLTSDYVVVKDAAAEPVAPATTPVPTPVAAPAPVTTPTPTEVLPESAPTLVQDDAPTQVAPQIVYVTAPVPPRPAGNRAFGALIALGATVIFAVLFAFAVLLILRAIRGYATMSMLANFGYWIPVGIFLVAFLVAVLVVNRGGWWAHIIGSFLVAVVVYVIGGVLITSVSVVVLHQAATVAAALVSPTLIAGAIIAREVALWAGVIVSHRGKRVALRNREARAAFDSEQAADAR